MRPRPVRSGMPASDAREGNAAADLRFSRREWLTSVAGLSLATLTAGRSQAVAAAPAPTAAQELFQDRQFAEGFGAAWPYGERFANGPRDGKLLAYRNIAPYQVHLIPEGPVQVGRILGVSQGVPQHTSPEGPLEPNDTRCHPWDFEEGLHHDFTDSFGLAVGELHEHRLAANHLLEVNTAERLQFAQFNNYRLAASDPKRNQKLVKRVTSDRRGTLRMVYNSQHEIRNAALAYLPRWARDTWPHFLLVQRFLDKPRLADYRRLDFSLTAQVLALTSKSVWPSDVPGGTPPEMNLLCYFLLQDTQARPLWVGLLLNSSQPQNYFIHTAREQWGMAFYREPLCSPDRPLALGQRSSVTRELKGFVATAITAVAAKFGPGLAHDPDAYRLVLFNFGWEGLGHWECEGELSGLSLRGTLA